MMETRHSAENKNMHNDKSALWLLGLICITLASPGVHAQNLDTTLNDINESILRYCGDSTFQYLDVQRSGQGSDVTLVVTVRSRGGWKSGFSP